ncbi:hypothetical protein T484DRAFT_1970945 [Baffinella frigidus]|nr:hypothetical protein T484DRAFT_1970945 [Cryptophyta sp. CCMP2293]
MKDATMGISASDADAEQQPATRKATFRPEHAYLHVALRFGAGGPGGGLDARVYKAVILAGTRELYGDVGLRGEVDVLEVAAGSAIVRVPHAQLPELWSVLTLITAAEGKPCRCEVMHVSPFLLSLSASARRQAHGAPASAARVADPWAQYFTA